MTGILDPASVPDMGAFLARLVRLDAAALVRLRPAGQGAVALWARLPFEALVTRNVRSALGEDSTVRASELLDLLRAVPAVPGAPAALPRRHNASWRWPLPPVASRVAERLPAAELRRVGAAAAGALREAATSGVRGRAVGERMLRDALLDHVPIVVRTDDEVRVEIPQRLVQAVVRMGFLGPEPGEPDRDVDRDRGRVDVRLAGAWVGLAAEYGTAWYRPPGALNVRPAPTR